MGFVLLSLGGQRQEENVMTWVVIALLLVMAVDGVGMEMIGAVAWMVKAVVMASGDGGDSNGGGGGDEGRVDGGDDSDGNAGGGADGGVDSDGNGGGWR